MKKDEKNLERYKVHAEFCKTFAHPLRLLMLESLRHGEKTVTQLSRRPWDKAVNDFPATVFSQETRSRLV